jgi:hypothetical protein
VQVVSNCSIREAMKADSFLSGKSGLANQKIKNGNNKKKQQ